jgi:hypothetical protein
MTGNGHPGVGTGITRLEVQWTRCYWRPRIAWAAESRRRPLVGGDAGAMTLYRRSGNRAAPEAGSLESTTGVDWFAVRYENPPSRITF